MTKEDLLVACEAGRDIADRPANIYAKDPLDPDVHSPPHYTMGKYEVIDVLDDWFADDPYSWQVVKYVARHRHKGKPLQDLEKAHWYLTRRINQLRARRHARLQQESNDG